MWHLMEVYTFVTMPNYWAQISLLISKNKMKKISTLIRKKLRVTLIQNNLLIIRRDI